MPVPKEKQDLYGKVVGHMINSGKSMKEAKHIADKAVGAGQHSSTQHSQHTHGQGGKCKACDKENKAGYTSNKKGR